MASYLSTMPTNVPTQLVELYVNLGCSVRAVEKARKVNRYYIYRLFKYGEEPSDKRKKGRLARTALFLPARKERKKVVYEEYVLEWRRLPKEVRHLAMKQFVNWWSNAGDEERRKVKDAARTKFAS